jgi:hypothetical protein
MNFFKIARRFSADGSKPAVVTFTGGMGAQMIRAAIYFSLKNAGLPVYADLSYFEKPESVAVAGRLGDKSNEEMQRGDYVNVASHLIADVEFIKLARKFSGLVGNLVVISDSPISQDFRSEVSSYFKDVSFLDNTDAFTAHRIMRNARILICSNSQFSLIAAALNPTALVLIPKQWFGENERHIEAPIHSRSAFQVMK